MKVSGSETLESLGCLEQDAGTRVAWQYAGRVCEQPAAPYL